MLLVNQSTAVSSSSSSSRITGNKRKDAPAAASSASSAIDSSVSSRLTRAKLHHLMNKDPIALFSQVNHSVVMHEKLTLVTEKQKDEITKLKEQIEAAKASAAKAEAVAEAAEKRLMLLTDPQAKLAAIQLPSHWSAMAASETPKLIRIDSSHHASEWKIVYDLFVATMYTHKPHPVVSVTRIERIQNPAVYRRYALKVQELAALDPAHSVDLLGYHGCGRSRATDAIGSIVKNGLDTNKSIARPGYIWLATHSGYSANGYASVLDVMKKMYQLFVVRCAPHTYEMNGGIFTINESARMCPAYLVTFSMK